MVERSSNYGLKRFIVGQAVSVLFEGEKYRGVVKRRYNTQPDGNFAGESQPKYRSIDVEISDGGKTPRRLTINRVSDLT